MCGVDFTHYKRSTVVRRIERRMVVTHSATLSDFASLLEIDEREAKALGREAVEKLTSKAGLQRIDEFFERHGSQSVLIARLLPFVSFDWVSYFCGLTSMSFGSFMVATGIGQLPATIVYSYVGGMLTGGAQMLMYGLLILFALAVLIVIVRQVYAERVKRREADAEGGRTS